MEGDNNPDKTVPDVDLVDKSLDKKVPDPAFIDKSLDKRTGLLGLIKKDGVESPKDSLNDLSKVPTGGDLPDKTPNRVDLTKTGEDVNKIDNTPKPIMTNTAPNKD